MPSRLEAAGVIALHLLFFLMISSLPKGIWSDEVLQFAWGAFPNTPRAIELIFRSVGEKMNHGQTGAYMVLNHLALKFFGASYFAFRLPSYLSYTLSLLAGFYFLRNLGVSLLVRVLFVLALGFSQLNLEHGWEARPYIVLQASVMGLLFAWEQFLRRAPWSRLFLLFVCVLGVLFHPFFVAYAGLIAFGTLAFLPEERKEIFLVLRQRRELLPLLAGVFALLVLFLLNGKFSWFNSLHKKFHLDPYEYVGHGKSLARFMLGTFFYPVSILAVPLLSLLLPPLIWLRKRRELTKLSGYVFLLLVTIAVSQFVITSSVIRSEYWILQRQWVAANALAILTAAFLVEAALRMLGRPAFLDRAGQAALAIAVVVVAVKTGFALAHPMTPIVPLEQSEAFLQRFAAKKDIQMSEFQDLAHQNLLRGGPVWPVFQRIYLIDTWEHESATP